MRQWLARIPETPFYSPIQAINDAEAGHVQVCGVRVNGEPCAVVLLGRSGDYLDAVAVAGDLRGRDGLILLVEQLQELARQNGLEGVVCRTTRHGLGRRLVAMGAEPIETIYKIEV